jgi:hypothetical protein
LHQIGYPNGNHEYMCPLPICPLSDQFQALQKCFACTKSNEMGEYHYHEWPNYVLIIKEFYSFQLLNLWHALLTLGSNTYKFLHHYECFFIASPTKAFLHSNTRMFCCALLSHQCLQLSLYFPTHLPIYETYLQNWLPRWNQILTQLRFIHNWVIMGIQWMLRCWVLVRCGQVNRSVNIDTRYLPTFSSFFLGRQANLIGPLLPKKWNYEGSSK